MPSVSDRGKVMAEFDIADRVRSDNEGVYQHVLNDKGNTPVMGTYAGIAPAFHPQWAGFRTIKRHIDSMVKMPRWGTSECERWVAYLNKQLSLESNLQRQVKEFYRREFWDKYRLGEIANQTIATWIYDHAVNAGARGIKWAQEAAGVAADGDVGPVTIAAINAANSESLLARMVELAVQHRINRVAKHPEEKRFMAGWLSRDGLDAASIKEVIASV